MHFKDLIFFSRVSISCYFLIQEWYPMCYMEKWVVGARQSCVYYMMSNPKWPWHVKLQESSKLLQSLHPLSYSKSKIQIYAHIRVRPELKNYQWIWNQCKTKNHAYKKLQTFLTLEPLKYYSLKSWALLSDKTFDAKKVLSTS